MSNDVTNPVHPTPPRRPDELEAGRELDALVAQKVFGFTVERRGEFYRYYNDALRKEYGGRWTSPVPPYSTDIAAAWEVMAGVREGTVERRETFRWALRDAVNERAAGAGCHFMYDVDIAIYLEPVDVCRAALKALESAA